MNYAQTIGYESVGIGTRYIEFVTANLIYKRPTQRALGAPQRTAPLMRQAEQKAAWAALCEAQCPYKVHDIYDEMPKTMTRTARSRHIVRMFLVSAERAGWIARAGVRGSYTYRRAK